MSKYNSYRYGESAVMPEGKPFILAIEGVDTKFELVHHLDAAGNIHMSVDVADETNRQRSSRVTMRDQQQRRRAVDDDEGDFDPHTGLLRDGRRIRVPMTAMDGRGTPSDPLVINTGLDLGKHFHPDGTPRRRDGSARRSRQTDQTTVTDIGGDRVDDASGAAAKTAAYNEMVADLQDAWKTPEQRAHTQRVTADATPPQGVTAADWAREQGIREMSDAWKPRDAAVPKILPVGAWPDTVQTEGASCSVDGALGTWTRGSDGYLYCRPKAMAATRADASVGTRDAVDQAWRAMVEEQANAWRS